MLDKRWINALGWLLFCGFASSASAQSGEADGEKEPATYPSAELLEFLADFGAVDEQTYELIEYHALQRDQPDAAEKKDDE